MIEPNVRELEVEQIKAKNKLKLLQRKLSEHKKRMKLNGVVMYDKHGRADLVPEGAIPPQSLYKAIRKTQQRIDTNRSLIKFYAEIREEDKKKRRFDYDERRKSLLRKDV